MHQINRWLIWMAVAGMGLFLVALQGEWRTNHLQASQLTAGVAMPLGPALVQASGGQIPVNGGSAPLLVLVSGVTELGASTVVIGYDAAVLSPSGCKRSASFDVTLCNTAYDHNKNGVPDSVRFNAVSISGVTIGISQTLTMAEITWSTTQTATVGGSTVLSVTVDTFTDTEGLPIPVTTQNGVITFGPESTPTPTLTATATATHTTTSTASPTPTQTPTLTPTPPLAIYLPLLRRPGANRLQKSHQP